MGDGRPHHPLLRASRRQDRGRHSLSNTETGFLRSVGWRPPRSGALPPGRAGPSHTRPCLCRASLLSKPGCNCTLNSCCFLPLLVFNFSSAVLVPSIRQCESAFVTHMSPGFQASFLSPRPIPSQSPQSGRLGSLHY